MKCENERLVTDDDVIDGCDHAIDEVDETLDEELPAADGGVE